MGHVWKYPDNMLNKSLLGIFKVKFMHIRASKRKNQMSVYVHSFVHNKSFRSCMYAQSVLHEKYVFSVQAPQSRSSDSTNKYTHTHSHTQSLSCLDLIEAQRSAPGHSLIPPLF